MNCQAQPHFIAVWVARLAKMKEIAVIVQQVALAPVEPSDFPVFKSELQAAFALAVIDELGEQPEGPIPDDADLDKSLTAPNALVLHIMADGEQVGGAVVVIDGSTNVMGRALAGARGSPLRQCFQKASHGKPRLPILRSGTSIST